MSRKRARRRLRSAFEAIGIVTSVEADGIGGDAGREPTRYPASVRGVLPGTISIAIIVLASVIVIPVVFRFVDPATATGTLAGVVANWTIFAVATAVALLLALRVDRGSLARFGLDVDRRWLRNFGVGIAISLGAVGATFGYGAARGFFELTPGQATDVGGATPWLVVLVIGGMLGFFLLQNLYEELVFRSIMLQNFAEGLSERGLSPVWAVGGAAIVSLLFFGAFHVPLRGVVVGVHSIFVGIVFVLAYLVTGRLGLAIGVHFGRFPFELLVGGQFGPVTLPSVVDMGEPTLGATVEVTAVQLGASCLLILLWAHRQGDLGIADRVYTPSTTRS